ncbi:MAG: hypothetical protein J6W53_02425, partial [Candidatus Methanomethylophilaceae archaeon]|nr:hypothetical protein [Candidatus Methanomethylophilaceae archaeon]
IDNGYNPLAFLTQVNLVWGLNAGTMNLGQVTEPDYLHDTLVMIVWGIVALVAAFMMFIRREF